MGSPCPLIGLAPPIEVIGSTSAGFSVQQLVAAPGTIRLHSFGRLVTVPHTRAVMSEGNLGPINFLYASAAVSAVNFDIASGSGS
jgi:hypothetical protein